MSALPYYNDLDLSLVEARRLLEEGAVSRKAAAHCPVIGTIGADGTPSQRVMILRHVDWDGRRLRFHTDARSDKRADLAANAAASVLIYDEPAKVQLRLGGTAQMQTHGGEADMAWAESTLFARRCYLTQHAPGSLSAEPSSGLPAEIEGKQPTDAEIGPGRVNFAILTVTFSFLEWLYLANSGHRRARFSWDDRSGCWGGNWLVP